MEMILRVLLVLKLAPGTLCQEIIFDPPTLITPCASKSRAGKDRFIFTGTFGNDVKQLIAQGWDNSMDIVAYHKKTLFYALICAMELEEGDNCYSFNERACSCVYEFKQIHFVVNYTLNKEYSQTPLGGKWGHQRIPNRKVISSKNYTLPEICDVNTALLTLTIAEVVEPFPRTRSCSFTLTLGTSNLMQLCCSDMAMPCYTQISFRGTVVATNESPCVTYSPTSDGVTGILQLSYSVCTQAEYIPGNNCIVQTGVVTTRVTAPTTDVVTTTTDDGVNITDFSGSTSEFSGPTSDEYATGTKAPVTAQPTFQKSNTLWSLFWAAILLILLVIICASVALWIIRGRRREQAARESGRESQRSSLPKAEQVESAVEEEKPESRESASTVSTVESEV